jgi:chemotaxis protein MotB
MRIILTGDLLFNTGKADLSQTAKQSLQKVAAAIKDTPYMINVVGHTDNLPMKSESFNTNWELSVARASRVARFLIEETGMNPSQFEVSGYSSFRPLKPNTSAENRAINRRVEIIISKKLPAAEQATSENLKNL